MFGSAQYQLEARLEQFELPSQLSVVKAIGEADVQIIGAVVGVFAPPPEHVRCDVVELHAAVVGSGAVDTWVAGPGGESTAIGLSFWMKASLAWLMIDSMLRSLVVLQFAGPSDSQWYMFGAMFVCGREPDV